MHLQEDPSPGGGADRHSGQHDYEYHEVEHTVDAHYAKVEELLEEAEEMQAVAEADI